MKYEQIEKYGRLVWSHVELDAIRRAETLCRNCMRFKPGEPDHCPIASEGYQYCVKHDVAYIMTRCPEFEAKPTR